MNGDVIEPAERTLKRLESAVEFSLDPSVTLSSDQILEELARVTHLFYGDPQFVPPAWTEGFQSL